MSGVLFAGGKPVDQHWGGEAPNGAVPATGFSEGIPSMNSFDSAQGHSVLAPYDRSPGPKQGEDIGEPGLGEAQAEAARLAHLKALGWDVSPAKPFEYSDARPVEEPDFRVRVDDLDFPEDIVDENGDIVEEITFEGAVPAVVEPPDRAVLAEKRGPGRPRK